MNTGLWPEHTYLAVLCQQPQSAALHQVPASDALAGQYYLCSFRRFVSQKLTRD
jgi:hypothetical protein